jgi:3-methyladenine DNA glycosylase/8-oxoguanine DNA glycosylase
MADKSILAMRIELAMAEAAQSQLRAQYYQKRIETGAWRERSGKVYVGGLPEHGGTPMPDERILRDEVETMYRHIDSADRHLDHAKKLLSNFDN